LLRVLIIDVIDPEIVRVDDGSDHEHFPLNSLGEFQRHRRLGRVSCVLVRRRLRLRLLTAAAAEYRCLVRDGVYLLITQ
jgi:hypothetical protein